MQLLNSLKAKISRNFINTIGWKTPRKIVVFESDDWGSIRMPDRDVYEELATKGVINPTDPYAKYDSLEREEDVNRLLSTLTEFKDSNGNPPVFTLNYIMANPDFEKIKQSGYETYFYEDFRKTYHRYPGCFSSFELIQQGIDRGVFFPQFHGREHVHINRWLQYLKQGEKKSLEAFKLNTFFFKPNRSINGGKTMFASFDKDDGHAIEEEIVKEGLAIFKDIFGIESLSFIAPNYIWDHSLEDVVDKYGVKYLQGTKTQNIPNPGNKGYKKNLRFTGRKSSSGLINIVRNCFFEPTGFDKKRVVESCVNQISNSFFWNRPAVISSHRLNFMGGIYPENREDNLQLLLELLENIVDKWPEVEFLTTAELGRIIEDDL
ncbi:MAG: hypothetical protein WD059_04830 [Balneolaceae bacterium]